MEKGENKDKEFSRVVADVLQVLIQLPPELGSVDRREFRTATARTGWIALRRRASDSRRAT
jgi:hypothetical protein